MLPVGGRVQNSKWTAFASDEFLKWLLACHNDNNAVMRVVAHFGNCVDKIELAGPHSDPKWVERLKGGGGLWKVNYDDNTGAYRMFFKFGRRGSQRVALFADGDRKTRNDFTADRYERAERQVDACMTAEGVVEAKDG